MLRFFGRSLPILMLLVLMGSACALRQSPAQSPAQGTAQGTGRISGKVADDQGGAIPGATVQVVSKDGAVKREVKSDDSGAYTVTGLPPGSYQVIVTYAGFDNFTSPPIDLAAGASSTFDAAMVVAASKEVVNVNTAGAAATVELETATLATTISQKEVTGLGLNGRNFSQLIGLSPGVSNQTGQDEAKVGVVGSAKYSVNGGRVEYNTFEVDGSDVLNTSINASRGQSEPLIVYPSIDAIQEIKVLTSDFSALYGKTASGSVLVTTKSGTDKFHGNAYYFLRNELFNARNYFDAPGRTPLYRRQDAGGTIGGPIFLPKLYEQGRNKTFFFFSEELRLEKTPTAYNQAVPTDAQRAGDFTELCPSPVPGADNSAVNLDLYPDCPHNGTNSAGLPAQAPFVSPGYTSQAILATGLIPRANAVDGCNTTDPTGLPRCYIASISPSTYWREELFRIDHKLTDSQQLSFRYVHDSWHTTTLAPQWGVVQNSFPTVNNLLDGPGLNMEASLAGSLPRGFVNRVSFSYTAEHITLTPEAGPGLNSLNLPAVLSAPGTAAGYTEAGGTPYCGTNDTTGTQVCAAGYIFSNGFNGGRTPGLSFGGSNGTYGGHGFNADTGFAPWEQTNPTYDLRDDASKTVHSHNLQFGVNATLVQQNETSAVSGANSGATQGLYTFSNQQSRWTHGNAFADFLAGPSGSAVPAGSNSNYLVQPAIKSYTQDSGQRKYYNRYKAVDIYLQDDWKVNSRLSLNVGIRASLFGPWYNAKNTAYNWRPEAYDAGLGRSVYVDPDSGYVARASNASPVLLNLNKLDPTITNGLVQCGVNGVPQSCMTSRTFFPGPRFGLSYDPFGDGKTAVHGGYGLFWEHGTGYEANTGSLLGSAPIILSETQSNIGQRDAVDGALPTAYNDVGLQCQGGMLQCGSQALASGTPTYPLNVTSLPKNTVYSYTQQYSLSVQREVSKNVLGQIAYVGTKGTHLTAVRDLNQLPPLSDANNPFLQGQPLTASVCQGGALYNYFPTSGINGAAYSAGQTILSSPGIGASSPGYNNILVACTGNPGFATSTSIPLGLTPDALRPYPGFSNIISVSNIADSRYNAFQGTMRATTGPLTLGFAYTYSHSIDDASDRASANFANSLDIHSNKASSDFDQRQLLNVSYLYDLPLLQLLHGFTQMVGGDLDEDSSKSTAQDAKTLQPLANDEAGPLLTAMLGGWQLSGITTFQTGTPFSVVNAGGANGTGAGDNAGVGDGLGIGSYADVIGNAKGVKPTVAPGQNVGPLLLNPGAFAAPRGLTFGNSGRNYLNNPSRTNFNASLLKHFKPFGEGKEIEFRAEAFNLFNHTQFRIYDPTHPGNTGNNVVNCYGDQSTGYSAGAPACLTGNSFLHPVDAHDPRILQFGLKASF